MSSRVWLVLGLFAGWAALMAWRRRTDARAQRAAARPGTTEQRTGEDDIDREALEQAEREVREMPPDVKGRPLEDVVGDDWGPGTPKPPYV